MSILMIFIDGIGIGEYDKNKNPFARFPSPYFPAFRDRQEFTLPFEGVIVATDPSMGIRGLPQSATGQTALLTGTNASKKLGHHVSGFPTPTLRTLLKEESIFLKLQKQQNIGTFANAFVPEYFERPPRRISATTWAVKASDFPFRMLYDDLIRGQAVSHDLTNAFLADLGYSVPIRRPEEAAEILIQILETVDFCLFEYILTDVIGHKKDMDRAEKELSKLHAFLHRLLTRINLGRHLVLLTSDHGNFEDLSISTHTHNSVPTTLWGKDNDFFARTVRRIEDVCPAILACLQQ